MYYVFICFSASYLFEKGIIKYAGCLCVCVFRIFDIIENCHLFLDENKQIKFKISSKKKNWI